MDIVLEDGRVAALLHITSPTPQEEGVNCLETDVYLFENVDGKWPLDEAIANVEGTQGLVSRLKTLFQTGRVGVPPNHPEAPAMIDELQAYEIKVDQNANDRYGAFRVGTHHDLVTALGLATQDEAIIGELESQCGMRHWRATCVPAGTLATNNARKERHHHVN